MAAPKENRFWMARSSHGRHPIFANPEDLLEACLEYFEWVQENPLLEEKVFCSQGEIVRTKIEHIRAMTIGSLCIFLGITHDTWLNYKKKDNDLKGFFGVIRNIEESIYHQKFSGAAAGMLNANIIARDLGLVDKTKSDDTLAVSGFSAIVGDIQKSGSGIDPE